MTKEEESKKVNDLIDEYRKFLFDDHEAMIRGLAWLAVFYEERYNYWLNQAVNGG